MTGTLKPAPEIRANAEAAFERIDLDGSSWVDVARGWLEGADALYEALLGGVDWQTSRLFRYDHWVEERRLGSAWRPGTPLPYPALAGIHRAIERRYRVTFSGFGLIRYRDSRDGQAFHRDTDMRYLDDTIICILTLGARRPWLLRPRTSRHDLGENRGATHDIRPGPGDLHVMGGRCQADWEHSVPYLRVPYLRVPYLRAPEPVGTRLSIQWRYTSRRGRPFAGSSYGAPLTYR